MKKSLLLLASLLMSTVSVFAQWTMPVPSFEPMADDGNTPQYLYNVEAGGFFIGANDWNTRASVSTSKGYKVKMTAQYESPETKEGPLGTWAIIDSVETKSQWMATFCENPQSIWVDNNTGSNWDQWVVTSIGDNKYEITNPMAAIGKLGMAKLWAGAPNTRLWLLDPTNEDLLDSEENLIYEGPCTTWAFVSVAEYDALIGKIAAYNAAMSLKAEIDGAPAGVDKSAAEAVFNNTNSTAEELAAAQAALIQAILDYNANSATPDDPKDMTSAIVNPNFDGIKFDGWNGSGWGAGGTTAECAERYSMNFDTYQEIEGLPNGVYKVLVNGFYRAGSIANDLNTKDDPAYRLAKLYAVSGTDSLYTSIYSLTSGASDSMVDGKGVDLGNGQYVPNSMADFVAWENAGYYLDNSVFASVENNKLKIGVRKDKMYDTDWTIVDSWRLMYYGNSLEAYKMWYQDVRTNVINDMNAVVTEDTKYNKSIKDAFNEALATGDAAASVDDIKAAISTITSAAQETLASIAGYKAYEDKLKEIRSYMAEHDDIAGDDVDALSDYLMEDADEPGEYPNGNGQYILDNCLLSTEEIIAEKAFLEELFETAIKNGMVEGSDVSNMLANPNFDGTFDGWTYKEGKLGNHNVECYDQVVDVYQVVENIPNGLYALSCQAFERPAGNGSYTGDEESKVFLFMNNFETPVQNICKDAISPDAAVDKENCFLNNGAADGAWPYDYEVPNYGYVPNSIDGAYYAFNKGGRYIQTVYGLVTDGKMKIGLTSKNQKIHWVLWANFKLTFMGKNEDALESVIGDLSTTLQNYVEENAGDMSTPEIAAADAAIAAGKDAADADEMWDALVAINNQITSAKANVAAVNAFKTAVDAMDAAADEYFSTATAEAQDAYNKLQGISCEEMTTAEIEAATIEINETAGKLRIPDCSNASDDNPIDLTQIIVNSNFDSDTSGWSGDGAAWGSDKANAEFYNKNFNFYQEFYGLPAGTYEVRVQAYYRQGNAEPDYKNFSENTPVYNAKLFANNDSIGLIQPSCATVESKEALSGYAKCGTGTDGDLYIPNTMTTGGQEFENGKYWNALIFKFDGNGSVKIGLDKQATISGDWTLFDNFQLFYYGPNSQKEQTGIESAPAEISTISAIYNVAGQKVDKLSKGINIIKMSDNSVRKVLVK